MVKSTGNKPTGTKSTKAKSKKRSRKTSISGAVPSKDAIVEFVRERDGVVNKRDIARHFAIKGSARTDLRQRLKEMAVDGLIELDAGKKITVAGDMPPVAPIEITDIDDDGRLSCVPTNWKGETDPPPILISAKEAARHKPTPGLGDRFVAKIADDGDGTYQAKIIRAIGKGAEVVLAIIERSGKRFFANPVDRRAKNKFEIRSEDAGGAKDGDLVWVEAKSGRGYGPKSARVKSIAGNIDDTFAYSTIALANHDIRTEFPDAVIEEAKQAKLPDLEDRTDLRETPLITIDPADARDHDDAIYAEPDSDPKNQGGFKIIVAIADVSYFVHSDSALDREAIKRGNSTYLPDRVVPMLPERLSNDLCSLRPDEDRPCLATEMTIDANGVLKKHRFMRAMMRSAAKLSYDDAQDIADGGDAPDDQKRWIKHLYAAFKLRMKERAKRAPLDLELTERKIIIGDDGRIDRIIKRERFDAHRVVEEFMILANVAAAQALERSKRPLIYRVHDQPDPERLNSAREFLQTMDYSLVKGGSVRPANFNQILKIAEQREQKEMISEVILRSQKQAIYSTENVGHFGLNLTSYAHFTSPIRRYADLTVHRALVHAFGLGNDGQTQAEAERLDEIAEDISNLERQSVSAEREASDRYLSAFLETRIGDEFPARIRGVTRFGLFVALDENGADGFVPMRTIGGRDYYRFEEKLNAVINERTGEFYRLGQSVEVELVEATPINGGLRFDLLSPPLAAEKKSRRKTDDTREPRRKATAKKTGGKSGPKTKAKPKRKSRKTDERSAKPKRKRKKSNAKPKRD